MIDSIGITTANGIRKRVDMTEEKEKRMRNSIQELTLMSVWMVGWMILVNIPNAREDLVTIAGWLTIIFFFFAMLGIFQRSKKHE